LLGVRKESGFQRGAGAQSGSQDNPLEVD